MAKQKTSSPLFQQVAVLQQATEQIQETLKRLSGKSSEVKGKSKSGFDAKYSDEQAEQLIAQKNEAIEEFGYSYVFNRVHGSYILANRVTEHGTRSRPTVFLVAKSAKLKASTLHRATSNGKVVARV